MNRQICTSSVAIALLMLLAPATYANGISTSILGAASVAGRVAFVVGRVTARSETGQTRVIRRGAQVYSGDALTTGLGRVQIRFRDGGFMSLNPGSEFQIERYDYSGNDDESDASIFKLLKGGLRALTGLIGRTNKKSVPSRHPNRDYWCTRYVLSSPA